MSTDIDQNENIPKKYEQRILYDADPNCDHEIEILWSGIRCKKCHGWYCI